MSPVLRRCSTVLVVLAVLVALSGCGSQEASVSNSNADASAGTGSATPDSSDSMTIDITVEDGEVKPSGSKVEVKAGQRVHLHIESDAADELHVHSSPEQEISFEAGSTDETLVLDQPGVVDVEIHDLDKLVVQLEVR